MQGCVCFQSERTLPAAPTKLQCSRVSASPRQDAPGCCQTLRARQPDRRPVGQRRREGGRAASHPRSEPTVASFPGTWPFRSCRRHTLGVAWWRSSELLGWPSWRVGLGSQGSVSSSLHGLAQLPMNTVSFRKRGSDQITSKNLSAPRLWRGYGWPGTIYSEGNGAELQEEEFNLDTVESFLMSQDIKF